MFHDFTIKKNIHVLFPIAMFGDTEGYIRVYPIKCRDILVMVDMVVSINGGTPVIILILIGCSILNHPFGDSSICGNTHVSDIIPKLHSHYNPK